MAGASVYMSASRDPARRPAVCVAFVSHCVTPAIRAGFERLAREAPGDHDVVLLLSSDDATAGLAGLSEDRVVRLSKTDVHRLDYPEKCRTAGWSMIGNLDLVILGFWRDRPAYDHYWFIEYDVHWQGCWSVLFERFRASNADVLGTSMMPIDRVPRKLEVLRPALVVPDGLGWSRDRIIKGFLPACRLSGPALRALETAYRGGLGGHYEILVPSVAAQAGLVVEDIGGRGPFVRPENIDRFYFAHSASHSHSPGSFVFRPGPRVLARPNTLWHPVKPDDVALLHPMRVRGTAAKNLVESLKPHAWRCIVWLWFQVLWHPLPDHASAPNIGRSAWERVQLAWSRSRSPRSSSGREAIASAPASMSSATPP